jgi:lysophospholipase L1-like esterase
MMFGGAPAGPAIAQHAPPTAGLAYVALGDSYAAGHGLVPTTGKPVRACDQSAANYPHRVASTLGLHLTDASCSGAVSADLVSTPQKLGRETAPPQSTALSAKTRVVTITIGGNDLGFVDAAQSCLALSPDGPILTTGKPTCQASFVKNGVDTLRAKAEGQVHTALARAFASVKAKAPNAKVFVVGYPALFPDTAHTPKEGCFTGSASGVLMNFVLAGTYPYTNTDVAYLHSVQADLDLATRTAALAAGFDYISTLAGSEAHTPCAGASVPYVNAITLQSKEFSFTVKDGALHPNARGQAYLAASVIPEIVNAFPAPTPTPKPAPTPAPPGASPAPWIPLGALVIVLAGGAVLLILRRRRNAWPFNRRRGGTRR